MSYYTEPLNAQENVSTADKPVKRCERCDRETEDYVMYVHPDNSEHIICWSCQQRDDKNYNRKPEHRRLRSGGRFLPKSPKFD